MNVVLLAASLAACISSTSTGPEAANLVPSAQAPLEAFIAVQGQHVSGSMIVSSFVVPDGVEITVDRELTVVATSGILVRGVVLCTDATGEEQDAPGIELSSAAEIDIPGMILGGRGISAAGSGGRGSSIALRAPRVWIDGLVQAGDGGVGIAGGRGGDGGNALVCGFLLVHESDPQPSLVSGAGGDGGAGVLPGQAGGDGGDSGFSIAWVPPDLELQFTGRADQAPPPPAELNEFFQGIANSMATKNSLPAPVDCLPGAAGGVGGPSQSADAGNGAPGTQGNALAPNGGPGGKGGDAKPASATLGQPGNPGANCCPDHGAVGGAGGAGGNAKGGKGGTGGKGGDGWPPTGAGGNGGQGGNGGDATSGRAGNGGAGGPSHGGGGAPGALGTFDAGTAGTGGAAGSGLPMGIQGPNGAAGTPTGGGAGTPGAQGGPCPGGGG